MRRPYDRIRVPAGSAAATAVLLGTAWAPFVFGIDKGPTPALVQSGLYVGLFVLTTVAPSLDNSSPQNIQGVMTVPPGIIVGSSDVVGSIVEFIVYARRTSGSGNVAVAPLHPIWCV